MSKQSKDIIWVDFNVDSKPLGTDLDTGSAVSIISFDLYQQKLNDDTYDDVLATLGVHNVSKQSKDIIGWI